jgi:hypothetical protein
VLSRSHPYIGTQMAKMSRICALFQTKGTCEITRDVNFWSTETRDIF